MRCMSLWAMALILSAGWIIGCDKKTDPATGGGGDNKELNLFAWSEYVPQDVIDGFTKETGIKVNYEAYASNEEMLQKLGESSKYDLLMPSEYAVAGLIAEKKLSKIDKSKVPGIKNLAPEFVNLEFDPGNEHSVPWMAGTICISVNTEKVSDDIQGFTDVFQPKHKGRIVVLDDAREIVTWALATQGVGANDITKERLEQVKPVLKAWLPLIRKYDSDSPKDAMISGDCDLGIMWNAEAALVNRSDPKKFKTVIPKEGVHMFIDSLVIPANAPNKEAAHKFIDYILRPEVSVLISKEFPYTNPNLEARKLLTPEELNDPASYPKNISNFVLFKDIGDMAGEIDTLFTDLKNSQ